MRAIIYARYSTEHQTESTIVDQLRRCRDYAKNHELKVVAEDTDEGISGAAIGNRPGVQRALAELKSGDLLLVVDTTRLSRSQDLAPLLTRLRHRGIRVVGVLDGFDSDSRTARMQAGLSGIMSEEFRAQIASRTHSALDMRARLGKATGGKCYGYSKAGEIIEMEAAIVREVFERAARGESMKAIVVDLNRRGVPSPGSTWERKTRRSDGLWLVSGVHSMLANDRYIGRVVWNRSIWRRDPDSGKRQRVERPESEWIVTDGPAIVELEAWEKVRALAQPRKFHGGTRGRGPKYVLSGILVCGECGGKLVATGANGSRYYCGTRHQGGDAACSNSVGARRDVAEEKLLEPISSQLLSNEAVELAVQMIRQWRRDERTESTRPAELEELDRRIARLEAQVAQGALDREDIAPSVAALIERRRSLLASSWRKAGARSNIDQGAAEDAYRKAVANMREALQGPAGRARAAVHALLGDVICRPEGSILVAELQLNTSPLLSAAGVSLNGSGGPLPIYEIVPLVKGGPALFANRLAA
jgi:DNA invertase Pin-like site-specific DNA recombinase